MVTLICRSMPFSDNIHELRYGWERWMIGWSRMGFAGHVQRRDKCVKGVENISRSVGIHPF